MEEITKTDEVILAPIWFFSREKRKAIAIRVMTSFLNVSQVSRITEIMEEG